MNELQLKAPEIKEELQAAFLEIQQPRSNYALKHFVVGDHHGVSTREYSQLVEELRRAHSEIKRSLIGKQKVEIERQAMLDKGDKISMLDAELKTIELEDLQAYILGKLREFACLYSLWEKYPKYTHEQLEAGEAEYWRIRLTAQAARDLAAHRTGISVSNQHGLERAQLCQLPAYNPNLLGPGSALQQPQLSGTTEPAKLTTKIVF